MGIRSSVSLSPDLLLTPTGSIRWQCPTVYTNSYRRRSAISVMAYASLFSIIGRVVRESAHRGGNPLPCRDQNSVRYLNRVNRCAAAFG